MARSLRFPFRRISSCVFQGSGLVALGIGTFNQVLGFETTPLGGSVYRAERGLSGEVYRSRGQSDPEGGGTTFGPALKDKQTEVPQRGLVLFVF